MPFPSFKRRSKNKKSLYSLDSASKYFLANHSTTKFPTLDELRALTGTERIYYSANDPRPLYPTSLEHNRSQSSVILPTSKRRLSNRTSHRSFSITDHAPRVPSPLSLNSNSNSNSDRHSSPARAPRPSSTPLSHHALSTPLSPSPRTLPPHPHHYRIWHAANLRCMFHSGPCPLCGEPCCAYRAARDVLRSGSSSSLGTVSSLAARATSPLARAPSPLAPPNPTALSPSSEKASQTTRPQALKTLLTAINHRTPTPPLRDEDSKIQCCECLVWVCPACIGACPLGGCGARVCVRCADGAGWERCAWHDYVEGVGG